MELVNSDILHRMQSRVVSKEMFDFDTLSARPLMSMLDYSDLDKLYNIASSVRYSGDIHKKLSAIREVMHNRGFRKLAQGTNRIVYSYFEDPSIVIKIATDKVGMKDNPREFMNQHLLKPFVTKVFEVTPDGVVGEFEKVEAITSREEFLSCAGDIYDLLNIITKKYIIADAGSRYFMNFGIRRGFGGVLLDFSYIYEPDCNKLICSAPNPNEASGICGGFIDYDAGFNELVCTKCGAIYRAQELAKSIEENKIIRKGRKSKMKVAVNYKGSTGTKEIKLDGQMGNSDVFKPASGIVRPSVSNEPVGKLKVKVAPVAPKVVKEVVVKEDKVEVIKEKVKVETPVVEEVKVEETPVVEEPQKEEVKVEPAKKKAGMKVKVTNQDGTTTETAVEHRKDEPQKSSGVKVRDNSERHYKTNYGNNLPRHSQIQLTAITFEQLKELDFKYSSTDLEFHKMFFRAEHEKSNPSVSVDFDSIPKDKLLLISGVDTSEVDSLKTELENAKADLLKTEDALVTLRKLNNDNSEITDAVKQENDRLKEQLTAAIAERNQLAAEKQALEEEIERLKNAEPVVEESEDSNTVESTNFDTDKLTFISGTLQTLDRVCEILDIDVPEDAPSNTVIAFNVDNNDSDFIQDQNEKTICVGWINDIPIEDIAFSTKQQVVMGESSETQTEE